MSYNCYVGIDCGLNGGITILDESISVNKIPLISSKRKRRNKKGEMKEQTCRAYDVAAIANMMSRLVGKKVLYAVERQSPRPGEGAISSFTLGRGFGHLEAVGIALGFQVVVIDPKKWRSIYSELDTQEIRDLRIKQKEMRKDNKTVKDKKKKLQNNKEIVKIGGTIKSFGKTQSRLVAAKVVPSLSDMFDAKLSDGLAESLLIANFIKVSGDQLFGQKLVQVRT